MATNDEITKMLSGNSLQGSMLEAFPAVYYDTDEQSVAKTLAVWRTYVKHHGSHSSLAGLLSAEYVN